MKKIKLLLMFVVAITLLSCVAFAADGVVIDGADTANYAITYDGSGKVTVNMIGTETVGVWSVNSYVQYDDAWTVESSETGISGAKLISNTGELTLEFNPDSDATIPAGTSYIKAVFALKDGETAENTKFTIYTKQFIDDYETEIETAKTYTVKAAGPVGPVSVATTIEKNGITFTNVPNAEVSGNVVDGALSISKILVNYWKDGVKVDEAKEFTNFAKPNFTGTSNGTVTFDVAIMGVPSNVVITAITAQ